MKLLPRDIQLEIIKRMDMDTRIKAGLVFKLRVPQAVKDRLSAICTPPVPANSLFNNSLLFYGRVLGSRQVYGYYPGIYFIRYYPPERYERYEVLHISNNGYPMSYHT